ncbi:hypothetical protein GMORB2_3284 [Geosmithia morbida]|uniref:Myb-like domain-containing protein n=1 Tax=Geosmithia morbida TaxID=1094350 RepID=A0A9P4YQW5_9HYPO|nr:uncharacterized protein GMORB2_3284 [Geosmithia morbida]KAF4120157.1 hypothetical protein GMORB2_3284 [Geosmithia morbida]
MVGTVSVSVVAYCQMTPTSAIQCSTSSDSDSTSFASDSDPSSDNNAAPEDWTISEDHQLRGMKQDERRPSWEAIAKTLGRPTKQTKQRWKTIKHRKHHDADADPASDTESNVVPNVHGLGYIPDVETRRQTHYLHRHIYAGLYPARSTFQQQQTDSESGRDNTNNNDECGDKDKDRDEEDEILVVLERKHDSTKWLEIQAGLYNATGRMVPLDVIRSRCRREVE